MKDESTYKKAIQEKVDQVHFEYDAAGWEALSKQLPSKPFPLYGKMAIGIAAASLIVLGVYFGYSTNEQESDSTADTEALINITKEVKQSGQSEIVATSESLEEKEVQKKIVLVSEKREQPEQEKTQKLTDKVTAESDTKSVEPGPIETTLTPKPTTSEASLIKLDKNVFCVGDKLIIDLDHPLGKQQKIKLDGKIITNNSPISLETAGVFKLGLYTDNQLVDNKTIEVNEAPNASFTATKGDERFAEINYHFYAKKSNLVKYEWTINGERKANASELTETFKREGIAKVSLSVRDLNGCSAQVIKEVNIQESFNLLSYDAFTPDGDGLNDAFIPKAIEANDLKFEMNIFTPSGNPLYSTTDYYQPWNGRKNNTGEKMPPGVYLWKVTVYDNENKPHLFSGQIRIIQLR